MMVSTAISNELPAFTNSSSPNLSSTLDPKSINPQLNCPLFDKLPPEIRTYVFRYALRASEDANKPYAVGSFYRRPGYEAARVISGSLLLTCRRIYLEAALHLVEQNELLYWWDRPPPLEEACRNPVKDLVKMSPLQKQHASVHVFVDQCNLEESFRDVMLDPQFRPNQLTLTLRYTDWCFWEDAQPIALDAKSSGRVRVGDEWPKGAPFEKMSWAWALCHVKGLQKFVLELGTVHAERNWLAERAELARHWVFVLPDKARLVCDPLALKFSKWDGVNKFYKVERDEQATLSPQPRTNVGRTPGQLEYYVVVLTWTRQR